MATLSDDEIRKGLQALCAAPIINKVATVVSVDLAEYTALVLPEGEAELEVRLKAGIDGVVDGVVEVPMVGSDVLISIIGNDLDNAYMVKASKVVRVIINGGLNGGLINILPFLNELNTRLELLKAATAAAFLAQMPIDPLLLGSQAFVTASAAITPILPVTIQDTKVLH